MVIDLIIQQLTRLDSCKIQLENMTIANNEQLELLKFYSTFFYMIMGYFSLNVINYSSRYFYNVFSFDKLNMLLYNNRDEISLNMEKMSLSECESDTQDYDSCSDSNSIPDIDNCRDIVVD